MHARCSKHGRECTDMFGMSKDMVQVLNRLYSKALSERSEDDAVPPDKVDAGDIKPHSSRMYAITEDSATFINILIRSSGFVNVLEVGMSVGYSTIWFAEAAGHNGGKVTTIERTPSKITRAKANFAEAGVSNVIILEGTALDIMRDMDEEFDFVLIDADKANAPKYFDLALSMLRPGGIIAVDNMTYPARYRSLMDTLARHIRSIPQVRTVTVPIGNGIEISTKLS